MVWVSLGEPERAHGADPPPEPAFITDPAWSVVSGETPLEANYMMLNENVLDLTHLGYVHRNPIKVTDWDRPPKVEVGDSTVTNVQGFPSAPLAFIFGKPTRIGMERPVYRKNWGRFVTPALNIGAFEFVSKWRPSVEAGYAQDKVILNPVQRIVSLDAAAT